MQMNFKRLLAVAWLAAAAVPAFAQQDQTPKCTDTPAPNVKSAANSLPVHAAIGRYLAQGRGDAHFECRSAAFEYSGERTDKRIVVRSYYKAPRRLHAEFIMMSENKMGGFREHAPITIYWPNGKTQAKEYYCYGFPVGFHQYFSPSERLTAVADYSWSSYEGEISPGFQELRTPAGVLYKKRMEHFDRFSRFREAYELRDGKKVRVAFQMSNMLGNWETGDLRNFPHQWLTPGTFQDVWIQGSAAPLTLTNVGVDLMPLNEAWQRTKKGIPGYRAPLPQNTLVLGCPWLDDAMALSAVDSRFVLPPVAAVSEAERAATPLGRYLACLEAPGVDCLLEQALARTRNEDGYRASQLQRLAITALQVGRPKMALAATAAALDHIGPGDYMGLQQTTHAALSAIDALAYNALGDAPGESRALAQAYSLAIVQKKRYEEVDRTTSLLVGRALAHLGHFEEAHAVYLHAVAQNAPGASGILAVIGVEEARRGEFEAARRAAAELQSPPEAAAATPKKPVPGANNTQLNNAMKNMLGYPFAGNTRPESVLLAQLAAAQGAVERGDRKLALALADDARAQLEKLDPKSYTVARIRSNLIAVYGSAGATDAATALLPPNELAGFDMRAKAAGALCEGGSKAQGLQILDDLPALPQPDATKGARYSGPYSSRASVYTSQARGYAQCSAKARATEVFRSAAENARKVSFCDWDYCANFTGRALAGVRDAMSEAGMIEELDALKLGEGDPMFSIERALRIAQMGKPAEGMKALQGVAPPVYPQGLAAFNIAKLRAEAEITWLLGEHAHAQTLFNDARAAALSFDSELAQAGELLKLAYAYLRLKMPKPAAELAIAAQIDADRVSLSGMPPIYHDQAVAIGILIVQVLTMAGRDDDAKAVMTSIAAGAPSKYLQGNLAAQRVSDITSAMATRTAENGDEGAALRMLQAAIPGVARLRAVVAVASRLRSKGEAGRAATLLQGEYVHLPDYFLGVQGSGEQRQLAGLLLENLQWLPADRRMAHADALERRIGLIAEAQLHARAKCEFASWVSPLDNARGQRNFDEILNRKKAFAYNDPTSYAIGACGYWLRRAAHEEQARKTVQGYFDPIIGCARPPDGTPASMVSGDSLLHMTAIWHELNNGELPPNLGEGVDLW
jgi:hypothetical protein